MLNGMLGESGIAVVSVSLGWKLHFAHLLVNRITPTKEVNPEFDEIAVQNLAYLLIKIDNPASGRLNR